MFKEGKWAVSSAGENKSVGFSQFVFELLFFISTGALN